MTILKNWLFYVLMIVCVALSGLVVAEERIELDNTSILGSRELPKVTYIVPWKSSNIGDLGNTGTKSYGEGINALDRELYRTELEYFGMLQGAGRQTQK